MKTKLPLFAIFISALSFSQAILNFTSEPNTNFKLLSPASIDDHTPAGTNTTWTFSGLTEGDTTVDTYAAPTTIELTDFPGSTNVLSITPQTPPSTEKKLFLFENGPETSVTGISEIGITLKYDTNAFIGSFPMNYNDTNTTIVSGRFSYVDPPDTEVNGTFTGTITTHVDAYGTLNFGSYSENVTRLRVDQTLNMSVPIFAPDAGTYTQVGYSYYNNTTNNIDFRYSLSNLNSDAFEINDSLETLEFNITDNLLSTKDLILASNINIYPNPANDYINIKMPNNETIKTLKIIDNQGREVLGNSKNTSLVNTKNLQSGLYFLSIETESGKLANKKFIKA